MTSSDERRNRRISYQAPVGGVLLGEQRVLNMVSANLSRGGMFVDIAEVPQIGSELVCNLATAGGQSAIQVRGRVAWHNGASGVGIQFVDLSEDDARELTGILGEGREIPRGEQSEAVYELVELECADTSKTVVDAALQAALEIQIDEGMDEMGELPSLDAAIELPSLDAAIELPAAPPKPQYDDVSDPAFTRTSGAVPSTLVVEETDKLHQASRTPNAWLLAAVAGSVGALAIGMAGFGVFSSDSNPDTSAVASADDAREGERQRVLALVEGTTRTESQRESAVERIRALALEDSEELNDEPGVGGPEFVIGDVAPDEVAPAPAKVHKAQVSAPEVVPPKETQRTVATKAVKRQVLGGVVVRESSDSLLIRLPINGSVEQESHYIMNEPAAFAVNLPYAQPTKGYSQSLEPESDKVRLLWVRERLGGVHVRVFFNGERPECAVETANSELVLRCQN